MLKTKRRKIIFVIGLILLAVAAVIVIRKITPSANLIDPFNNYLQAQSLYESEKNNDVEYYTDTILSLSKLSNENKEEVLKYKNINEALKQTDSFLSTNLFYMTNSKNFNKDTQEIKNIYSELESAYAEYYTYSNESLDNFFLATEKSESDVNEYTVNYLEHYSKVTTLKAKLYNAFANVISSSGIKGYSINDVSVAYLEAMTSCAVRVETYTDSVLLFNNAVSLNSSLNVNNLKNIESKVTNIVNTFAEIAKEDVWKR